MRSLAKCHRVQETRDQACELSLLSICVGIRASISARTDTFQHLQVTKSSLEIQTARALLELVTSCDSCSFPPSLEWSYLTIYFPKT